MTAEDGVLDFVVSVPQAASGDVITVANVATSDAAQVAVRDGTAVFQFSTSVGNDRISLTDGGGAAIASVQATDQDGTVTRFSPAAPSSTETYPVTGTGGATGPAGATGGQGARGPTGATGPRGTAGVQGPAGDTGAEGPVGPAGKRGPAGPEGPQGATGAAGSGAAIGVASVTSVENADGTTTFQFAGGSYFAGKPYGALTDTRAADGMLLDETRDRDDGSHVTSVYQGGQKLAAQGFDTFLNDGTPRTTFVFDPGEGRGTVDLFRAGGADHDTLSLDGSDFGNSVADVLNDSRETAAGLLITDPTASSPGPGGHDTILLRGITAQDLTDNKKDVKFHI